MLCLFSLVDGLEPSKFEKDWVVITLFFVTVSIQSFRSTCSNPTVLSVVQLTHEKIVAENVHQCSIHKLRKLFGQLSGPLQFSPPPGRASGGPRKDRGGGTTGPKIQSLPPSPQPLLPMAGHALDYGIESEDNKLKEDMLLG